MSEGRAVGWTNNPIQRILPFITSDEHNERISLEEAIIKQMAAIKRTQALKKVCEEEELFIQSLIV